MRSKTYSTSEETPVNNTAEENSIENLNKEIKKLKEEIAIIVKLQKISLQLLKQIFAANQVNLNENTIKDLETIFENKEACEELFKPIFHELEEFLHKIYATKNLEQRKVLMEKEVDKWKIVSSTRKLIEKFSQTHDVSIPMFFLEAIKAIHQHKIPEELREKIVKKLSLEIRSLIQEMFTKDPYIGLLKKIKGKPIKLDENEVKAIDQIIRERIESLADSLKNADKNWKDCILSAQFSLEAFNWGSAKTEKRFLQLFYQKAKKLVESVNAETKFENKILNSEAAILICELSNQLLKIPKLRMKIEEMKSKI